MPIKTDEREYRAMAVLRPVAEERAGAGAPSYMAEGYATTFDQTYPLYYDVLEQVASGAIDARTDLSDVIMQFDHAGRVLARTRNGTLELNVDEHGLAIRADLSRSQYARETWEEIDAGLVDRMSFAFVVDGELWDDEARIRTITHIKKIYDVSVVSIPANDATEISARSRADGLVGAARDGAIATAMDRARARARAAIAIER